MKRVARIVSFAAIGLFAVTARTQAQTPASSPDASRFFASADFAATFGHKSSGAFGAEAGYRVMQPLTVFFEVGHMLNAGTEELDADAQLIANAVGATSSASYHITYYDWGVRYAPAMGWPVRTYVMFGIGGAHVESETALAVNGTTVPPESLGVQFGTDLNGTFNKPFITLGGGVMYPFMNRYFLDGSYRYGRVLAHDSDEENFGGINTSRLQLGVGIRF